MTGVQTCALPIYNERDAMNVFPNPSNGHVFIDINLQRAEDGTVTVHDLMGKVLYTRELNNTSTMSLEADLSALSKGMYTVVLRTKNKRITRKLMLN